MNFKQILLTAALSLIMSGISAFADTTINHLPYTINTPGTYTLSANLSGLCTPAVININASNLTLDLNGYNVTMNATATGNSNGIVVNNANNVTITNGSLTYMGTAYNFMLIPFAEYSQCHR
jgi:hypothetical protein